MKLSEYANKIGVTYQTAWNWWKLGYLNAEQLPSGTIIVAEEQYNITIGTCGCFDLTIHPGHLIYLQKSKELGTHLTVLLNTDSWIRANKREPILPQEHRKLMLEALSSVDQVILFETNEEKDDLIKEHKFDIWTKACKGDEYKNEDNILEAPTVKSYGGKVIIISSDFPEYSTTSIIEKIALSIPKTNDSVV